LKFNLYLLFASLMNNMKPNYTYFNSLPDFLAMQRVSFCWFIAQGLTEELTLFSQISNFEQSVEYSIFGEEYRLIKPSYNLLIARKYNGNYRVKLVIPLEVRSHILNTIHYQNQFPIVTLPLMTTHATFIINGCERVIVSQIIRSPGIYFERLKKQRIRPTFKRKHSTDIAKLRSFLPSGQTYISEFSLFFSLPKIEYAKKKNKNKNKNKKLSINWRRDSCNSYSIKLLKQSKNESSAYFLESVKFYQALTKVKNLGVKINLTYLFVKWLKANNNLVFGDKKKESKIYTLVNYFNSNVRLLIKYQILTAFIQKQRKEEFAEFRVKNTELDPSHQKIFFLKTDIQKLQKLYGKILNRHQLLINLKLNSQFVTITKEPHSWFNEFSRFSSFNKNLLQTRRRARHLKRSVELKNFSSLNYFSTTLKDRLKYHYLKPLENEDFDETEAALVISDPKPKHHRYLKTKTQLLTYKSDHQIQTFYHERYKTQELYTAIVIPDQGSWIRLSFQKNTKIHAYKYPVKNQEDEIMIQLDKLTQKPVLHLLREIGLTHCEIDQNLQYSDFFYFNKPTLLDSRYLKQPVPKFTVNVENTKSISEFSRLFDQNYYRLGKLGRLKLNTRLNLQLSERLQSVTYEDLFAIIDKLIELTISQSLPDDIDHLKNRRVRSIGELLQNLFRIGFQRLVRKLRNQTTKPESNLVLSFSILNATIREFFGSSQLSQYLDQTNPLSSLTHRRRISGLGPGGFDRDRISFAVRDIHPSHYGRICPIETPEGQNVGLIASLTTCARVNKLGFLETPFWRVINGKVIKTGNPIYLTAELEDLYKIAPADLVTNDQNYITKNLISVRYQQDFVNIEPSEIDFIAISTIQVVSIAASLIPFFEHDDANRALMGSNMQRQSVPLLFPQKPIVGTGLENQIANDSGLTLNAHTSGFVTSVTASRLTIQDQFGKSITYKLQKYLRSNQQTCINYRPIVWKGEKIQSGQIMTDGPAITNSELALGQNMLVAYMPWQGYNFEDAILISERLIYENILTSIHIERYKVEIDKSLEVSEELTKTIPNLDPSDTKYLNNDGIVKVGTFVQSGDILVGRVKANNVSEQLPESKLLRAIFGAKAKGVKDSSYRMPEGEYGRIIETITFNRKTKSTYTFEKIYIFVAQIRKIQVGDKIAGRHGNKGIISRILARQDMPFLPDGTPIDVILNPLGVPSRMNVGQLYECLLGLAGDRLNSRFKILPFDEMYGPEMSRILINKKLRQASIQNNEGWLFNPYAPGKMVLIDGRTGKEFENPITVGNAYMLKLIHLVDDKMHARATGPYSLITQQPLRGKAQHGGQRFGEMEVWALEGFGAAFTLKELLTIKSDDMPGRNETLSAIVKGQAIPKFGIPESFKVLLQELRSIGLDLSTYKVERFSSSKKYMSEISLIKKYIASAKTFPPTYTTDNISF